MIPNNEKAFRELIIAYESIDAADIEYWLVNFPEYDFQWFLKEKTGFGDAKTCMLCKAVTYKFIGLVKCTECLWMIVTKYTCYGSYNKRTFDALSEYTVDTKNCDIEKVTNTILDIINKRVKRMKVILKRWETKQSNPIS